MKIMLKILISLLSLMIFSCHSLPETVNEDWTAEMFFNQAQEASDEGHYDTALFYYEVFLIRYPEDYPKVMAAKYEKAVLHKRLNDKKRAVAELKEILDIYKTSPMVSLYPPRYQVLAQKVLDGLEGRPVEQRDPNSYPAREVSQPGK